MKPLLLVSPLLLPSGYIINAGQRTTVVPARDPLSVGRIIELTKSGASDATFNREIADNGLTTKLTSDQVVDLKQAGVSEAVIQAAMATPVLPPRPAQTVVRERVYEPAYYYPDTWVCFDYHPRWRAFPQRPVYVVVPRQDVGIFHGPGHHRQAFHHGEG